MSTNSTFTNLLQNSQVLLIGPVSTQSSTDIVIPAVTFGQIATDSVSAGAVSMNYTITNNVNTIFYYWSGMPSDSDPYLGALVLGLTNGSIVIKNSDFKTVFGQSDNQVNWSIINSTIIGLTNNTGDQLKIAYEPTIANSGSTPQDFPYPFGTVNTFSPGSIQTIDLAYPSTLPGVLINTSTVIAVFPNDVQQGGVSDTIAIINNSNAKLQSGIANGNYKITSVGNNNYSFNSINTVQSGLPGWAWTLIIIGALV